MTTETHQASADETRDTSGSLIGRWLVISLIILLAAVLLVLIAGGIFGLWIYAEHRSAMTFVKEQTARARAIGEPMTTEDLYAYHRAEPGTPDASQGWLAALESFDEKQFNIDGKGLPFVGDGNEEELRPDAAESKLAAAEAYLQKYDNVIQATLAAAALPGEARLPFKFEQGFSSLPAHAQRMRNVIRLFALRVHVQAHRGDSEGALESLEAMFAASEAMEHQLSVVEQQIRAAVLGAALFQANWLLNEVQLSEEQLAQLQARLQALDLQAGLTTGLLGERALGLETLQKQSATSGDFSRVYLEAMSEFIAASRMPFPEALEEVRRIEREVQANRQTADPWTASKHVMTALALPAHIRAFEATGRLIAYRNLLVAAIAAERYRLQTGAFPSSLANLVPDYLPAVPIDPFDGAAVRMTVSDGELTIYSVGSDGNDDGGIEGKVPGQPDAVVRVRAKKGEKGISIPRLKAATAPSPAK